MQIADIEPLRDLLGKNITFLAHQVSGGVTRSNAAFVGTHALSIPLADFSAGRVYEGDFIEISSDWQQSPLGDDYHLLTIRRVPNPCDAGELIAEPRQVQGPVAEYPHFRANYFEEPVTRIEVFEREVRTRSVDGIVSEELVYDSHIRFVAGRRAVVLTTEHGTILGEIEIHVGASADLTLGRGMDVARLRTSL